jgi:hypothetical protein
MSPLPIKELDELTIAQAQEGSEGNDGQQEHPK